MVDLVRYTGDTLTPANSVFIDMNFSEKLTKMGVGGWGVGEGAPIQKFLDPTVCAKYQDCISRYHDFEI